MSLNRRQDVREQYRDPSNFSARVALHARYSTNPQNWNEWLFEHLRVADRAQVFEVGCGPGLVWRSQIDAVPQGWRVFCTDLSPGMVSAAKSALDDPRFTFGVTDAQFLPLPDDSADIVIANHMLYHVPDINAAMAEFARVLRPAGRFFATTNGRGHLQEMRALTGWPSKYIEAFGLETGPAYVERHFDDVVVEEHPNLLKVTEVEPVMAYIASMTTFGTLSDERVSQIRQNVQATIDREGVFEVHTSGGLISATVR